MAIFVCPRSDNQTPRSKRSQQQHPPPSLPPLRPALDLVEAINLKVIDSWGSIDSSCVIRRAMPGPVTPMDDNGLVFSCRDEEGVIEVVDDLDTRALYFGTSARQSAMSREEPHRLVLSYTRSMLSGLLFTREPRSALVLGLGGGSLPRFLMHVFPTCRIDVVERRAKVVQVAHDYFHLARSPRLRTHVCDAEVFLRENPAARTISSWSTFTTRRAPPLS